MKRGLTGVKPEAVSHWIFEMLGARPDDDMDDMYPGTGAVGKSWGSWRGKFLLPDLDAGLRIVERAKKVGTR